MLRNCNEQASLNPELFAHPQFFTKRTRHLLRLQTITVTLKEQQPLKPLGFTFLMGCRPRLLYSNKETFLDGDDSAVGFRNIL
jgi:hypothetical protein